MRILAPSAAVAVLAGVFLATAGAPPAKIEVSAADVRAPTVRQVTADEARLSGIELRPRVMLVGDSIAGSLAPGVGRRAPTDDFFFFDATVPGLRAHQRSR